MPSFWDKSEEKRDYGMQQCPKIWQNDGFFSTYLYFLLDLNPKNRFNLQLIIRMDIFIILI